LLSGGREGVAANLSLALAGDDEQARNLTVLLLDESGSAGLALARPQE
jgi:hypothetical protein